MACSSAFNRAFGFDKGTNNDRYCATPARDVRAKARKSCWYWKEEAKLDGIEHGSSLSFSTQRQSTAWCTSISENCTQVSDLQLTGLWRTVTLENYLKDWPKATQSARHWCRHASSTYCMLELERYWRVCRIARSAGVARNVFSDAAVLSSRNVHRCISGPSMV